MQITNLLEYTTRAELRQWLIDNHKTVKECWVTTNRTKNPRTDCIPYIEVVEEALCFGWIDTVRLSVCQMADVPNAFRHVAKIVTGRS